MAVTPATVEVRINENVLWVGGEAYPLRNISHVGQRVLQVDTAAAWKKFILRTLSCLIIGGILAAIVGTFGTILLFAVEALLVWQLVRAINEPTLYGLVLNTSGTQRSAVWSTDAKEIQYLINEITRAIGNPNTPPVVYNVQHAVTNIHQHGSGNIGMAMHSGSGNIATGG